MNDLTKSLIALSFAPQEILPSLLIGIVVGIVGVLLDVSLAALIFSGSLANHLSMGIGMVLASATIIRAFTALTSSYPCIIADLDPVPTAILAWMAAAIARQLEGAASEEAILLTVLAAISITSLLTGAFLWLLGHFRIGNWVRSIPYSVLGGFLASTGWLLVSGAFEVMTELPLGINQALSLVEPNMLARWLPGLGFTLCLLLVSQWCKHVLAMPLSLLAGVGLFYGVLSATQFSIAEASRAGWMLGPFAAAGWQPLSWQALGQIHWPVIINQTRCIGTVMVISALSILLTATSLEVITQDDLNLNQELRITGWANMLVGLSGGAIGYHTLSDTLLVHQLGGRSRWVGMITAAVCLIALIGGIQGLAYCPRIVLGGLLLFLGGSLLWEWLYEAWFRLTPTDYLVTVMIFGVSITAGFLPGITIGWLAAAVL